MNEQMQLQIQSDCRNVSFARVVVAAFISRLDPTIEELEDVKTAVSEAVTNAIIHGYRDQPGIVTITCRITEQQPVQQALKTQTSMPTQKSLQYDIAPQTRTAQTPSPEITISIQDTGIGIPDIKQAMEPMYTGRPDLERSGMGFSFMEAFMDNLQVESALGKGTTVTMKKSFRKEA